MSTRPSRCTSRITVPQLEQVIAGIEDRIRTHHPEIKQIFLEARRRLSLAAERPEVQVQISFDSPDSKHEYDTGFTQPGTLFSLGAPNLTRVCMSES